MRMEMQQNKNVQNMCYTLKQAAEDIRFKKAVEWLKKDQKTRLENGYYDKDNLYGKDL